ncbi:MAG TPA: peptide deformylase [Candidatus Magasanikbacteria bacterium]|jgi:peptide deformylase|nr:peptide deformylase [Candidatus Magasanikbacteria bacterium]HQF57184.1 peptide deformylase [Candidatus Magasanikbacteria bacterium]HQL52488.1 peptide deformylase [Candidatus Magasanikbacteria bacterium]
MILPIVTLPATSLRQRSKEIEKNFLNSKEFKNLLKNIISTMYHDDGIGIAAPQVGQNIRFCIIGRQATPDKKNDLILINPIFEKISRKKETDLEGCLSVPKTYGKVTRYKDILVKAWNEKGEEIKFEAHNFFARVIQHEIDHLDGILFIDKARGIYTID